MSGTIYRVKFSNHQEWHAKGAVLRMPYRSTRIAMTSLWLALILALSIGCGSGQDPAEKAQELAKTHVNDNIDALSEEIAGLIVDQNPLAREIGGEIIEDEIHENVKWTYSQATLVRDDTYEVIATADLDFEVGVLITTVNVNVSVPIDLTVDVVSERVKSDVDVRGSRIDVSR